MLLYITWSVLIVELETQTYITVNFAISVLLGVTPIIVIYISHVCL